MATIGKLQGDRLRRLSPRPTSNRPYDGRHAATLSSLGTSLISRSLVGVRANHSRVEYGFRPLKFAQGHGSRGFTVHVCYANRRCAAIGSFVVVVILLSKAGSSPPICRTSRFASPDFGW